MKKITLLFVFTIFSYCSHGQNYRANYNIGYGFYNHEDLKVLQSYIKINYFKFDLKETEEFPSWFNYSLGGEKDISENSSLGINLTFYTTGARNHIQDYSGELAIDMPINMYALSTHYKLLFSDNKDLKPYMKLKIGYGYSVLKIQEKLVIYNEEVFFQETKLKSSSFFTEPSLGFLYNLKRSFSLDFNIGYFIDFKGGMHLPESEEPLQLKKDEDIQSNWSGFRITAGIAYSF